MSGKEKKLNDDVLTCEICFRPFSADPNSPFAPKTMNCLHSFCKDCLAKAIAQILGATQVECFVCREPTPIDKALGVESLKTNFMLQNIVSIMSSGGSGDSCTTSVNTNQSDKSNANTTVISNMNMNGGGGGIPRTLSSAGSTVESSVSSTEGFSICGYCDDDVEPCLATHTCLQCEELVFCSKCSESHKKKKVFRGHDCVLISSSPKTVNRKCSVHTSEKLKYVCMTCDPKVLLCMTCEIDNSHKDRGHKVISIETFESNQKETILTTCNEAEELLNVQKEISTSIEGRIELHQSNVETCRSRIVNLRSKAIELVETVTTAWLNDVETEGSKTSRILVADKKAVRIHIDNAELFIGQVKSIVASETGVSFYDKSTKAFDSLKNANEVLVSPFTLTDITAIKAPESVETELISSVARLFQSNPFGLPANRRVHIAGRQIRSLDQGMMCNTSFSENIVLARRPDIQSFGQGQLSGTVYFICLYVPHNNPRSPSEPLVFAADYCGHRVQVFNANTGAHVRIIGSGAGSGAGQMSSPWGVCILPSASNSNADPMLYVADAGNHRIQVFNATTGAHVRIIGSGSGSGAGQMSYPFGVCILPSASNSNADPMLYVADHGNHRIQVFNANTGAHVRSIAHPGGRGPHCVVVARNSADGNPFVYVGDNTSGTTGIKLLS